MVETIDMEAALTAVSAGEQHANASVPALKATAAVAAAPQNATPADLIRLAMQSGADLDRLERLWHLQVEWEKREAEKAYFKAFAAFKAEAIVITRNVRYDDGPLEGKRYADLHGFVDAVTPSLSKHGLSASWSIDDSKPDWIAVTCTLAHEDGYSESVTMGGPPDVHKARNALQARNSTLTYLERYTFKAICGVAEQGDDDDGRGGAPSPRQEAGGGKDPLVTDGYAKAREGMTSLTAWWASLTTKQRTALNREFGLMRKEARNA